MYRTHENMLEKGFNRKKKVLEVEFDILSFFQMELMT